MQIIMKKLALILLFSCSSVFAQSDDTWYKYAESNDIDFYLKIGSYEPTKDGGRVIQKAQVKNSPTIRFRIVEMKSKDCKQGYGFVYSYSLDGKLEHKFDYVENGGTIAQELATSLCNMIKKQSSV